MLTSLRRVLLAAACTSGLLAGTAATATAGADWRTTETSWTNPQATRPLVVDLRYARHEHFDRVVVDLRGRRPGYRTLFTDQLTYDPSGQPVPLDGRHKTYLTLNPAATYTQAGRDVYDGPGLVRPGLPALRGIALVGSWEGVTSFGFTTRTRPYRVFTLTDPSRVVIDFRHPVG